VHAHGLVHRDIKPSNIAYDRAQDTYVLIDFGLASARGPLGGDGAGGTWGYRGPEHVLGSCCALPSTDLWAFGMVVLGVLRGEATPPIPPACQRSTR
jgi:serine/threonine-protein kinase